MKLVLIDGNAIMHRAYHALPPLTNKEGKLTNAVYGFLSMLLSLTDKLQPTHLIVCFDRPEPTFRKSMYSGYQAQRPKMDDDLSGQFDLVKEVITAMNIPIYEKAGYEADDVIGTLAYQATKKQKDSKTIIVTGDKDILQLINDQVRVYMPVKGLTNGKLYNAAEVEKKFGIKPNQIVDYKALAGDPSDNYPGVRGIGPKTASTLLQEFGTVEKVYEAIKKKDKKALEIKPNTIKALSEYAEDAAMAKKLAKILDDAPVTININKAKRKNFDSPDVLESLQKLGFASLAKRILGVEEKSKTTHKSSPEAKKQKDNSEQLSLV